MDEDFSPHTRDDVVFRQLKDEWVVFDPEVEKIHVLNLVAALVWTHCDGDMNAREIAESVASSFEGETDWETVLKDTRDTLGRFKALGLLQ